MSVEFRITTEPGRRARGVVFAVALALALAAAQGVHADICPVAGGMASVQIAREAFVRPLPGTLPPSDPCIPAQHEQLIPRRAACAVDLQRLAGSRPLPATGSPMQDWPSRQESPASESAAQQVKELPPPPGSLTVALSSLATLGAWQLIRSAKHAHLGSLPEWYHAGGPSQVGHVVPAPPDLRLLLMPLCFFDVVSVGAERVPLYDARQEVVSRVRSQFIVPLVAPRGPPSLS